MKLEEYLINPMGKGSSVLMQSEIKRSLDSQFNELSPKMSLNWHFIMDKYLIAHIRVPSRKAIGLFYDVIFEFDITTLPTNSHTINKAEMRVFSNCPSFAYTYASVFNENRILCDWAIRKYPKEVLSKDPIIRNKQKIIGFERSLYLAGKYLTTNARNYTESAKSKATIKTNYLYILNTIKKQTEIDDEYKSKVSLLKKKNDKVFTPVKERNKESNNKSLNNVHNKGKISKTKTTKMTKKTSKTKKIKKI